jgi:hypothetical protein
MSIVGWGADTFREDAAETAIGNNQWRFLIAICHLSPMMRIGYVVPGA